MTEKHHHITDDEAAAPWSCEGMQYRLATLEALLIRQEGRLVLVETSLAEHKTEVETLSKTQDAQIATLVKMQETLELMKEVLTTYNHVKSAGKVFGSVGKSIVFLVKAIIACAAIYGFIRFGKIPE